MPLQNVLRASLSPDDFSESTGLTPLPLEEMESRYGHLFGAAILERWNRGGKEITQGIPGIADDDEVEDQAMEE